MPDTASISPPPDLLCENCGYSLKGLPNDANCPECGQPVEQSDPSHRKMTEFERGDRSPPIRFFGTAVAALFRPTSFFRGLVTRPAKDGSPMFDFWCSIVASTLFAIAAAGHFEWARVFSGTRMSYAFGGIVFIWLMILHFLLSYIAARLTVWEGNYRGLRLTLPAVRRALHFHTVHYLPLAVLSAATVLIFTFNANRWRLSPDAGLYYLYILCAEVVLGAAYLFWTYWIAMRNIMYANA